MSNNLFQCNIWQQLLALSHEFPTDWHEYERQFEIKKLQLEKLQAGEIREKKSDFQKKYLTEHQISKSWMENEYRLFIWFLFTYAKFLAIPPQFFNHQKWSIVSECFNKQPLFCQYFYLSCKKLKSSEWREEEDAFITKLMSTGLNKKWTEIGLELFVRSGGSYFKKPKSIRERWLSHLNPEIKKEEWNVEEDLELLKLIKEKGRKWSKIAKVFGNRTEHTIKNRYNQLSTKYVKEWSGEKKGAQCLTEVNKLEIIYQQLRKQQKSGDGKTGREQMVTCAKIEDADDQVQMKVFFPIILSMAHLPDDTNWLSG